MKSKMLKIVDVRGNVATVEVDVRTVEFARLYWGTVARALRGGSVTLDPRAWLMAAVAYLRILWSRGAHA